MLKEYERWLESQPNPFHGPLTVVARTRRAAFFSTSTSLALFCNFFRFVLSSLSQGDCLSTAPNHSRCLLFSKIEELLIRRPFLRNLLHELFSGDEPLLNKELRQGVGLRKA